MADAIDAISSSQFLSIAVPAAVFLITVFLIIRRLISFVFTCLLLVFALVSGFAIFHNQAVAQWLKGDVSDQEYAEIKNDLSKFKDQVLDAVQKLTDDLSRPRQPTEPQPAQPKSNSSMIDVRQEMQHRIAQVDEMLKRQQSTPSNVGTADPQ